jgi:predicted RNase H-like nuclease (RuvC/YqgF family)
MEPRTEWTDARLNDLVERLDRSLERLDQDVRKLRSEMRELRGEVSALRRDGPVATMPLVAAIIGTGILT